ncbi:Putative histone deacetylase family, Ureohydrolase domain superfamily [Septoria linicola]|uniref:Histone deacetylase family, Ureohydrolase domain superfamily n=1 Tax=Septoria linicola TaxID=215465 RepID=A0A9Q9AXY2_9PEZI|nr:putative histone deacetylase family, Ureohydrolase domain superfamily [Septoria linicola]USW54535.1 Putative histone deacetylase family, Ureohydrolase domain superfamily [Septoria linicola]
MEQTTPGPASGPQDAPSSNLALNTSELSQAVRQLSIATDGHSPRSAPPTPNLKAPSSRRTSAASPNLQPISPRPQPPSRRSSSSMGLNKATSSPGLRKKSSRTSLGGADDQESRSTPKRSISNLISGLREAQSRMESIEEPVPLTAAQLATAHFTRELLGHGDSETESDAVVILHDACYGHRWSRLKTSKGHLSLIVERPERIHASVLGASTAYVRLGGHHQGALRAPHPDRNPDAQPPFKIRRTARKMSITSPYVTAVHGTEWMTELHGMCDGATDKLAAGQKEVARAADKEQLHDGDLYLAPGSMDAFQGALGGVADAVDAVLAPGSRTTKAFVAVRPPGHHCSADHPSGFCWLNNVHVGIEYAAQLYGLTHTAIFDFDLHHGDGSQAITWQRNSKNNEKRQNAKPNSKLKLSPDIGYYSLHDINSYPCEWGDDAKVQAASLCVENAHSQSVWNVHLQPWQTEDEFWKLYEDRYRVLVDKARLFLQHHSSRIRAEGRVRPNAAIFISAGFDASEWEGQGMQRHKVSVPTDFYARFTEDVVKLANEVDGCGGRVISVLEGGYSDRALCSGVLSHLSGLCATPISSKTDGIVDLMHLSNQMNGLSMGGLGVNAELRYDKTWWSDANLTALEHKINPPPPPQAKKLRVGPQPTYATPTESFAYKVVDTNKFARSISGTMRDGRRPDRAPTPPPPEVNWVVATQELSQLLIPSDRQTKSCTAEELAVPRSKKEVAPVPLQDAAPRQLRDRRSKAPTYAESAHGDEGASVRALSRNESRASRRETIDTLPSQDTAATQQRRLSRRLSAGSALSLAADIVRDTAPPPVPSLPITTTNGSMKPPPVPAPPAPFANKKVRAPVKAARAAAASASAPGSPVRKSAVVPRPPAVRSNTSDKPSDVDGLTSGLKKITLKAPASKEDHDRKQMEKLNADRRARALKGAETRRVNAAAKKAALSSTAPSSSTSSAGVKSPSQPAPAAPIALVAAQSAGYTQAYAPTIHTAQTQATHVNAIAAPESTKENLAPIHGPEETQSFNSASDLELATATPAHVTAAGQLRAESGPGDSLHSNVPRSNVDAQSSIPVPAVTAAPTPAMQVEPQRDTYELPASVSAPEPVVTGSDSNNLFPPTKLSKPSQLPVFSSTGYIPFGSVPTAQHQPPRVEKTTLGTNNDQSVQDEQREKSIWDVPDTPAK